MGVQRHAGYGPLFVWHVRTDIMKYRGLASRSYSQQKPAATGKKVILVVSWAVLALNRRNDGWSCSPVGRVGFSTSTALLFDLPCFMGGMALLSTLSTNKKNRPGCGPLSRSLLSFVPCIFIYLYIICMLIMLACIMRIPYAVHINEM